MVPAVDDGICGEVGTIEVAIKETVAFHQNLAHVAVRKNLARIRYDAQLVTRQQPARRHEADRAWSVLSYGSDHMLAAEMRTVRPDACRTGWQVNGRLGNRENIFRHRVRRLQRTTLKPDGR